MLISLIDFAHYSCLARSLTYNGANCFLENSLFLKGSF